MWRRGLDRWPLLAVGAACIGWASGIAETSTDPSDTRSFVLAVGSMFLGAWLYSLGHEPPDDKEGET